MPKMIGKRLAMLVAPGVVMATLALAGCGTPQPSLQAWCNLKVGDTYADAVAAMGPNNGGSSSAGYYVWDVGGYQLQLWHDGPVMFTTSKITGLFAIPSTDGRAPDLGCSATRGTKGSHNPNVI